VKGDDGKKKKKKKKANATRIIKGGTSEKTPRCHWVMVVLDGEKEL
jgi:hypothetical protein